MNKRNKKLIILTAVIVLGVAVAASHATTAGTTGARSELADVIRDKVVRRLAEELDLSSAQVQEIKEKSRSDWQQNKVIVDEVVAKAKELKAELEKEYSNPRKVDALVGQINDLRGELLKNRIESVIEIKGMLEPEQFAELKVKLKERQQLRKGILKKWLEIHAGKSI